MKLRVIFYTGKANQNGQDRVKDILRDYDVQTFDYLTGFAFDSAEIKSDTDWQNEHIINKLVASKECKKIYLSRNGEFVDIKEIAEDMEQAGTLKAGKIGAQLV